MDFDLDKEQRDVVRAAREFAEGEFPARAREFDRTESFDREIWRRACELGFVGVFIDEANGGAGMGFLEHCLITEELWAVDPGCGQAVLSTTFGAELLQLFGSEEQRAAVLPRLVAGEAVMATAITEPDAGSDPSRASTRARLEGDEWVVDGSKTFITNGTIADFVLLFCETEPEVPDRHGRHSFLLVETGGAGYQARKIHGKMGIRASDTAEISLTGLRAPAGALVGARGAGFRELMAFFDRTRLHIAAQGVGLARACLADSIRHVKGRVQFGQTLASMQATQLKLAEMATRIRASRSLYYEAAVRTDRGKPDAALVAMAKWMSARTAVEAADEAVQMHGGYGYIDDYRVQRLYRDAKVLEIYEGAKEIEKLIVARSLLR